METQAMYIFLTLPRDFDVSWPLAGQLYGSDSQSGLYAEMTWGFKNSKIQAISETS